jgi:DNA-binding PadR family transcriptional regulator
MKPSIRRALEKMVEDGILSKHPKSYRLSEQCRKLIEELAELLGINQTAVVELAIRKLARIELGDHAEAAPAKARRKGK